MAAEVLTIVTSPSTTALGIMVLALLVAAWVPGRRRRLGFQPARRDSELDWARDTLDELRLAGPVDLLDTRIEGRDQPMANTALLQKLQRVT